MFTKYRLILVLLFISFSSNADVLGKSEMEKLLNNSPNIVGTRTNDRSLQIWILNSNGKGVIWCESHVNEDKASTETICFDNKDPDK